MRLRWTFGDGYEGDKRRTEGARPLRRRPSTAKSRRRRSALAAVSGTAAHGPAAITASQCHRLGNPDNECRDQPAESRVAYCVACTASSSPSWRQRRKPCTLRSFPPAPCCAAEPFDGQRVLRPASFNTPIRRRSATSDAFFMSMDGRYTGNARAISVLACDDLTQGSLTLRRPLPTSLGGRNARACRCRPAMIGSL